MIPNDGVKRSTEVVAFPDETLNDLGNNQAMQAQMDALCEQHDAITEFAEELLVSDKIIMDHLGKDD